LAWQWVSEDPLEAVPESLASLVAELDVITVTVALTAGIAAMVVFITDRGTSAVGVGVSIATIPAAAYAGLAIADGDLESAGDALSGADRERNLCGRCWCRYRPVVPTPFETTGKSSKERRAGVATWRARLCVPRPGR
jgi:hypothetical protein